MDGLLGEDLHAKRVPSVAFAVTGVLPAANLATHAIGRGIGSGPRTRPEARDQAGRSALEQRRANALTTVRAVGGGSLWGIGSRSWSLSTWTELDKDSHATISPI